MSDPFDYTGIAARLCSSIREIGDTLVGFCDGEEERVALPGTLGHNVVAVNIGAATAILGRDLFNARRDAASLSKSSPEFVPSASLNVAIADAEMYLEALGEFAIDEGQDYFECLSDLSQLAVEMYTRDHARRLHSALRDGKV